MIINFIKYYDIIDNCSYDDINHEFYSIEINLFNINDISNLCNLLKRKLYNIFFGNDVNESINNNKNY